MTLSAQATSAPRVPLEALDVIPTGVALAAEARGVDLRHLDDAAFAQVMDAWHEHSVLLFRGQSLSDQELIAFSRRLGDLDWAPVQETGRRFVEGLPEIYIVSNVKVNGEPIGSLGDGEAVWHTDMSYLDVPPKASMSTPSRFRRPAATRRSAPVRGLRALSARLKERIAGLKIKHDGTYNSGGYVRQGVTATDDPVTSPGAVHPLVCTHPPTAGACSISAAAATPTWSGFRWRNPRRCSTSSGPSSIGRSSPGSTSGASATSCSGTIAAPCTGATRSIRARGGSCIAPRSRVSSGRHK